ncbi:hypothetical protein [Niveispirillum sp.]|uniref:hypothetical protein n=1 Tax=Niveispirillum sp. TaxID=1917217 RepID=UPI001B6F3FD2|nr:hypothetical protein [Niveispirillum sp.]MBP7335771.1 hypothetical protein [Niveispirillum sp.]
MLTELAQWFGVAVVDLITFTAITLVVITLVVTFALSVKPKRLKAPTLKQYNAELFKRRMELEELSYPMLNDIKMGGGKAGTIRIDHVMRLPASILLVISAPADVAGQVRCIQNAGQWKYVRADHTVGTFINPVLQLHPLITAIRSRFPLVRVRVMCVFPRNADFGGRTVKTACMPEDLVKMIREMAAEDGTPQQAMDAAWESLSIALRQGGGATETSGSESKGRRAG